MYDITTVVWKDNTVFQETDNLHVFLLPIDKPFDEKEVANCDSPDDLLELSRPIYDFEVTLLGERLHILQDLQARNFDLMLIDYGFMQS